MSFTLPHQGIVDPRVFRSEFCRSNHWATLPPPPAPPPPPPPPSLKFTCGFVFCTHLCSSGNFCHGKLRWLSPKESQLQQSHASTQPSLNYKVHAGSFPVSMIHQTLTETTGCLTCVRDHSCACVIHRGVGQTDSESAQHVWLGKTHQKRLKMNAF